MESKKKSKYKSYSLNDPRADWLKVMGFGVPGSGKTLAIKGFVENGLRCFVLSTDMGGNGLRTIKSIMSNEQKDMVQGVEMDEYEQVRDFLLDPQQVAIQLSDGKTMDFYDWNPDMLIWEGFSNFQLTHLDSFVLSLDPNKNSSRQRLEGLKAELSDFDSIGRGTLWCLDKFLTIHNPNGKFIHKYVTYHEDSPREDKISGDVLRGPLLEGRSRNSVGGAFDLIIQMKKDNKGKDVNSMYYYVCKSDKTLSKCRGLNVLDKEEADMGKLWRKLIAPIGVTV